MIGKVIVQGLEVRENHIMDFRRPVRSVVLDPDYAKSSSRRVVSGGMAGQLILSEKGTCFLVMGVTVGWFGTSETTLHSGEGPIYAISWRGQCIAWANDAVSPYFLVGLIIGGENMAYSVSSTNYFY
jgi:vacuolar protein sorting-associated protein 41